MTTGCSTHKSRSDDTLLTVDFNLRGQEALCSLSQVPQRTVLYRYSIVPAGLGARWEARRSASPTVNKVLSHAGHFAVDTTFGINAK